MLSAKLYLVVLIGLCTCSSGLSSPDAEETPKKKSNPDKPQKKKKDIRDFTDADMERLYEEWEEKDDPLEPDELPEYKRPPPKIDLNDIQAKAGDPEGLLQLSKKGRTLMMFVTVSGSPPQHELDQITQLWQTSLYNAHHDVQRFLIDENRAIFMFKDGAKAWEAKEFLLAQERCLEVSIEGKVYPGKAFEMEKQKTEL